MCKLFIWFKSKFSTSEFTILEHPEIFFYSLIAKLYSILHQRAFRLPLGCFSFSFNILVKFHLSCISYARH